MTPPVEDTQTRISRVELLQERLRQLLREREQLRGAEADRVELEQNRRAIVDAQWELSRALIARHNPSPRAA